MYLIVSLNFSSGVDRNGGRKGGSRPGLDYFGVEFQNGLVVLYAGN